MSKTGWVILAVVVYLLFFHSKGQAAPRALTEDEIAELSGGVNPRLSADGLSPQGCRCDGIPIGSPLY